MTHDQTQALIADLQGQLDEHRVALTALLGEVRQLREGERGDPDQGTSIPSWSWQELNGDDRRRAWHQLAAWTDWLVATYRLGRWWSDDWYRHPGMVEETKALSGFHLAVAGRPARGPDYFDWHQAVWAFAARAPQLMADHRSGPAPLRATRTQPTAGDPDFMRFVEEEVAAYEARATGSG
jgi:hypothetical protein